MAWHSIEVDDHHTLIAALSHDIERSNLSHQSRQLSLAVRSGFHLYRLELHSYRANLLVQVRCDRRQVEPLGKSFNNANLGRRQVKKSGQKPGIRDPAPAEVLDDEGGYFFSPPSAPDLN